ncbi:MAG: pyridoxamine 5'-phosphate oxidase family protein [Bacillota bacterium]|nr:pyridoxamine 5'-phosphate oxidase family protein [Eubacteriales bacterium]MDI9491379.1 pyridoxamine 5'-phosphate oxidase family protein [Bacillota bacterium]NLV70119.1 pyridoxamine 5'-phosphate oxidase family protein [Clostridiales bacterium]
MRRKDREMDRTFGEAVIDKARYGIVSINARDLPYSVPLSLARSGGVLYFHSAREGHKVDLLVDGAGVRVVFVGDVRVPDLYTEEELGEMVRDPEKTSRLIRSVFTTEYESAIVEGRVSEVTTPEEKRMALRLICRKFTPEKMAYFDHAADIGVSYTKIFRIDIESITAKRKQYDESGVERKNSEY